MKTRISQKTQATEFGGDARRRHAGLRGITVVSALHCATAHG